MARRDGLFQLHSAWPWHAMAPNAKRRGDHGKSHRKDHGTIWGKTPTKSRSIAGNIIFLCGIVKIEMFDDQRVTKSGNMKWSEKFGAISGYLWCHPTWLAGVSPLKSLEVSLGNDLQIGDFPAAEGRGYHVFRETMTNQHIPSGELTFCHGKIHHFSWENPLFQWPFSIAFCRFTRGYAK